MIDIDNLSTDSTERHGIDSTNSWSERISNSLKEGSSNKGYSSFPVVYR